MAEKQMTELFVYQKVPPVATQFGQVGGFSRCTAPAGQRTAKQLALLPCPPLVSRWEFPLLRELPLAWPKLFDDEVLPEFYMKKALTLSEITRKNVEMIARIEAASHLKRPLGQRIADKFAAFIGSWTFIISQITILVSWMILNLVAWLHHWDPYPFILLNLMLTFQAAFAGPVLMMSQNRQARLNEQRNHLDLQINLLAEQENTEMLILLRRICDKLGLELEEDSTVGSLASATDPGALIEQIQETQRAGNGHRG